MKPIIYVSLLLSLTACGGGGGGSASPDAAPPPTQGSTPPTPGQGNNPTTPGNPPTPGQDSTSPAPGQPENPSAPGESNNPTAPNQSGDTDHSTSGAGSGQNPLVGVWAGQFEQQNQTTAATVLIAPDGRMAAIDGAPYTVSVGFLEALQDDQDLPVTSYEPSPRIDPYASLPVGRGDLHLLHASPVGWVMAFRDQVREGAYQLHPLNRDNMPMVPGLYKDADGRIAWVITQDHRLSGSDTQGCTYLGTVRPYAGTPINRLDVMVTGCPLAGAYTGLAGVEGKDNRVQTVIYNADRTYTVEFKIQ